MPEFILADIEGIGVVLFLIVSFVSWILNMKNQGNKPDNKNRNRPGQPRAAGAKRPDALKNELEMFLEEVSGKKPRAPKENPQRPLQAKQPRRRVEQQRPAGPRPNPAEVQQQRPRLKKRPKQQRPKKQRPKPPQQPVQEKPRAKRGELGSKLRDHVDDYMGDNRVEQHVEEHLADGVSGRQDKRIGKSVQAHLGASLGASSVQVEIDPPSATTAGLVAMLRNPNSVRNAIMVNEILQRPKSLRK